MTHGMSHNESYLNIEAMRQKEGIRKSEDDRVEKERVMTESDGCESKGKRKGKRKRKKMRGVHNKASMYVLCHPSPMCP